MMKQIIFLMLAAVSIACSAQNPAGHLQSTAIKPGAERMDVYLPLLKGKRVGIFANQTSMVGKTHLVDTLQKSGVIIKVIFGPEHGFRGTADAGEKVGNYKDEQTGLPVVSLYGSKHKPSREDIADVDVLVFDIQDVGVRFYTFISSLQEFMEAAIEYDKPLILLDRPNPNGFYVDGPVLDTNYRSFVGMQPVPVVYGMTLGEYARMLLEERWLEVNTNYPLVNIDAQQDKRAALLYNQSTLPHFSLTIIRCANYTHKSRYVLPVQPSPNLPEIQSIYWYPSTCFFEGTVLSEGRGTPTPFEVFGHPSLPKNLYSFTPVSRAGAKDPKLKGQLCYGWNLHDSPEHVLRKTGNRIQLKYLIEAYRLFPDKDKFFLLPKSGNEDAAFFNKLAGNGMLMKQLRSGASEEEIRKSWEPALANFKMTRKKYLLYTDFDGSPSKAF